jgi:Protein of unknown function (DUF3341)
MPRGTSKVYLNGDFQGAENSIAAVRELRGNGFNEHDLAVFSEEPVEFPRGLLDRPSHMSLVVVLGAITFFLLIVGFVYFTQTTYPLVTGGMPIFSFWSTGVVFYEITMLGSILTTVACFLWQSGLWRNRQVPVPTVTPGIICVRVHCSPEQEKTASEALRRAGALRVEQLTA